MKKIFFILLILPLFTFSQTAAYWFKDSIIIDGKTFQNIDGSPASGSSWRNSLTITNSKKVIIRNCNFPASLACGIEIRNCEEVLIENNVFSNNSVGVFVYGSTKVKVWNNQFVNVHGDASAQVKGGNFIKFNEVYGEGNSIKGNIMRAYPGESLTEDLISIGNSSGVASSPLLIDSNFLYGQGGNSTGAVGAQIGDGGGSYINVSNNFFYGQAGAGTSISGGHNNIINNNKVLIINSPVNSVGIYIADYSGGGCINNSILNNLVSVTRKDQTGSFGFNERTDEPYNCEVSTIAGNNWNAPLSSFTVKENPFSLTNQELITLRKQNWFKYKVDEGISVLPVKWVDVKIDKTVVKWSTEEEINNNYFTVQGIKNKIVTDYKPIIKPNSTGKYVWMIPTESILKEVERSWWQKLIGKKKEYKTVQQPINLGTELRIKQTDIDGKESYSKTIKTGN